MQPQASERAFPVRETAGPPAVEVADGIGVLRRRLSADWLRRSTHICSFLETANALGRSDRLLVSFAIMWAPYGGSGSEELLVTFGFDRARFVSRLGAALTPAGTERPEVQKAKALLLNDLMSAWGRNRGARRNAPHCAATDVNKHGHEQECARI